jgi:thiamine biosynthesis lipoprotein
MWTQFQIIVYASDQATAEASSRAAFERIDALDRIMSDYQPTSELMRLCQKAGGDPVPVSEELFYVLSKAQEVSKLSEGAFDVTVGPVIQLWRRTRKTQVLPDPEQLAKARALVGYDKMHLDAKARTVQLTTPGMLLDLGGIAKGYAADEAQKVLKQHGIARALVAAGGDIAVSGPPPDAEGWSIAIEPLDPSDEKSTRTLLLHDAGVSTSGDANQYVEIDGKRYSHIIDPRTGMALIGRQSVTVVAPNGITADSMTKVVMVLGPERGLAIIDQTEGTVSLIMRKAENGEESFESKQFKKRFGRVNNK